MGRTPVSKIAEAVVSVTISAGTVALGAAVVSAICFVGVMVPYWLMSFLGIDIEEMGNLTAAIVCVFWFYASITLIRIGFSILPR